MKTLIITLCSFTLSGFYNNAQSQIAPTWSDDVACIIYSHCTGCHNSNGIAPMSLLTYTDAINNAGGILYNVTGKIMPPWPPDMEFNQMAHDRSLSEQEIQIISDWVNNGTPEGNTVNAPTPPVYTSNELITSPDLVLQIPDFTIPALTNDLYRCFVIPTGTSVQNFLTAFEVVPGARSAVHHVLVYSDTTGESATLDANDPGPGYTAFGGVGVTGVKLIGGWVPGSSASFFPDNIGPRIPSGTSMILQIHYPIGSTGNIDSTKVNFKFSDTPIRELRSIPLLNHQLSMTDGPLIIPADTVITFHEQFTVPFNASLISIAPHAHLICESMKAYAVTLAGDTINLINIPHWDFHWQGGYAFPKVLKIPIGTKLHGEATYNNTLSNPHNPNNPPQSVSVGESTTEEMMLFFFSFLPYQTGDENIVIDTASHLAHYLDCSMLSGVDDEEISKDELLIMPNPASGSVSVYSEKTLIKAIEIFDLQGKTLKTSELRQPLNIVSLDISQIAKGCYYLKVMSTEGFRIRKIIID